MDKNVQEVNLNCRICNKIDSESNWLSSNLILKTGELVIAIKENGDKLIKIGDGTNTFRNLNPIFIDENSINALIKNAIPELTGDITSELIYDEETKTVKLKSSVVDNSHNHTISNISSLQEILDTKAPINNPAFTGTPTVPTAAQNTNTDQIASTKYVDTAILNKTEITGNAGTATKLATARTIDGVAFDGTANITHFGTCSTGAATAAKVVSVTGFTLTTGAEVTVQFTVTNTAASPTLNVNGTGAKDIVYRNAAISAGYLAANRVYKFVYDGTNYELIGDIDTNTKYTAAKATPLVAGTAAVGTSTKYAREDHVHPLQTTVSGNAGSATKLLNSRKISLIGDVTGSANFDGTSDININATVNLDTVSESQVISLILALS